MNIDKTLKDEEDNVGRALRKVLVESHRFYVLMLLQTANSFENNRATLSLFKGVFETKQIKKRGKAFTRRIEDNSSDEDNRMSSRFKNKAEISDNDLGENSKIHGSKKPCYTESTQPNLGVCVSEASKGQIKEEDQGEVDHHFMSDPRFSGARHNKSGRVF